MSFAVSEHDTLLDGVPVGRTVVPGDAAQAAEVLAAAARARETVVPVGRGTRPFTGAPAERLDVGLSTAGLDRVVAYEPGDLTVTVEAGVGPGELDALLARHGQRLPGPLRDGRGTIGGLVATAPDGSHTLAHGRVRDGLIGATLACADGSLARGRGRVVKNVAGYDTPRLMAGSLGTLALIVDVTFRLLPRPEAMRLLVARARERPGTKVGTDAETGASASAGVRVDAPGQGGLAAVESFMAQGGQPFAADVLWDAGGGRLVVGLEGSAVRVEGETRRLRDALGAAGCEVDVLDPADDPAGAVLLARLDDPWGPPGDDVLSLRVTGPAAADPALHAALCEAADAGGLPPRDAVKRPWLESAVFRFDVPDPARRIAEAAGRLLALARRHGPTVLLVAPRDARPALDVWGPAPPDLPLMARVRDAFDPDRVLASGRFVGGL